METRRMFNELTDRLATYTRELDRVQAKERELRQQQDTTREAILALYRK